MFLPNLTQDDVDQIRAANEFTREFREFAEEFEKKGYCTQDELIEAFRLVTRSENYLEEIKRNPIADVPREALLPLIEKVKLVITQ